MAKLAKFPKKKKTNKRKATASTYEKRMQSIKRLKGKYNGWWIYQYVFADFALRVNKNNKMKRR
jgi:hypothetical protein